MSQAKKTLKRKRVGTSPEGVTALRKNRTTGTAALAGTSREEFSFHFLGILYSFFTLLLSVFSFYSSVMILSTLKLAAINLNKQRATVSTNSRAVDVSLEKFLDIDAVC